MSLISSLADHCRRSRSFFLLALALTLPACSSPIHERVVKTSVEQAKIANYRISPGDVVRIDVFQEPDMTTEQRVAQDGSVNVPLVGRIKIGDQTVEEAAKSIADRLRQGILNNPQVTLNVTEYSVRRFSVLGQVNNPGAYEIPAEDIVTLPTAIAMAQGNTRIGNLRRVLVTRVAEDGSVHDITVNLMTSDGRQFVVRKGDVIMVPESLF